jgi:hypothetical protein
VKKINRKTDWPEIVRTHLAKASVGGSTLRGQCPGGGVRLARDFLIRNVPITNLKNMKATEFLNFLNTKTSALSKKLKHPDTKRPNFGAARKVINIFIRLCAMNKDLHREFKLANVEPFLEVPLDSHVVDKIRENNPTNIALPARFTIRDLIPDNSSAIQEVAMQIAKAHNLHRYELDVLYW